MDGVVPPTWHHADSDSWQTNPASFWVDTSTGLRTNQTCHAHNSQVLTKKISVALWPKVLDPWLPAQQRRNTLIPGINPGCQNAISTSYSTLRITGVVANSIYRSASNSTLRPSLNLQAVGGSGQYHWYINGEWKYSIAAHNVIPHSLTQLGNVQIVVVDDSGNVDKVDIQVL